MGLVQRQLASFEALKRLGFEDTDISVDNKDGKILTVLKTQGKRFEIGFPDVPNPVSIEVYQTEWRAEAERYGGDMSTSERDRIFHAHYDGDKLADLTDALIEKGFEVPTLD